MRMQLLPTRAGMRAMQGLGLSWGDVLRLMDTVEQEQPCNGGDNRRSHLSGDYILFTAKTFFEGERALNLLGISQRNREGQVMRVVTETKAPKQSRRGGSGTLLPTSFEEILERIEEAEGWSWERKDRKHIAVYGPEGQRSTIPVSSSDWRAIANNVAHLRRIGLDVKRKAS